MCKAWFVPRAKIEGNLSSEWAARNFLSTSVRSPSRDFLFANTVTVQTMEAWFCRMFALCQVCSTSLGSRPLLAAPDRCPPTSLGCPSMFGRGIALASLPSDSSSSWYRVTTRIGRKTDCLTLGRKDRRSSYVSVGDNNRDSRTRHYCLFRLLLGGPEKRRSRKKVELNVFWISTPRSSVRPQSCHCSSAVQLWMAS